MSIYEQNGYINREAYLTCLAEDYNVSLSSVKLLAGVLGEGEDFDGLVNALEDCE